MAEIQARLQALSEEFQKLQKDMDEIVQSRQKLDVQKQENLGVQKVFSDLKNDENIYKLVGPVLLKQEKVEAEGTVNSRLEFIDKEISRKEQEIKETQDKIEKKKVEIMQVQATAQAATGGAGAGQVLKA